jgi:glycosyltransferase involved in cell wall biosynthesis
MRVGLVVPGGVDRSGRDRVVPSLLLLVERLAARFDLTVFVVDYHPEPQTYPLLGATVRDLGRVTGPRGLRRLRITARLRAALERHGPFDVLHAYWGMPAGIATVDGAKGLGVPVVVTLDSGELVAIDDIGYGLQRRWIDRRAIDRLLRHASAVTVATAFMANLPALARSGVGPIVIPIGVDPQLFPPALRAEGPPWRLLRVGSINPVKDYATLLHTVAQLPGDVSLDIVGEDTMHGAMEALARRLAIEGRVSFHGWQPHDRLPSFFARAHLNIVSSRHESANVTVLEAAASGVPTVGTAVGFVADWDGDRAVAVPAGDPTALAAAIGSLLRDPERRTRLAEAARTWTLAHDADSTAAAFASLYERVVTRR